MSDNQNNNESKKDFISHSAQNDVSKHIKFNVQHNSNNKSTPPKFQPEKTKSSNIILTSDEPSKNKE